MHDSDRKKVQGKLNTALGLLLSARKLADGPGAGDPDYHDLSNAIWNIERVLYPENRGSNPIPFPSGYKNLEHHSTF